jgi:hypothetical protein
MEIRLALNSNAEHNAEVQADLLHEFGELTTQQVTVATEISAPPPGTLPLSEVTQLILRHPGEALTFLKTVYDIVRAVVERFRGARPSGEPSVVIVVGNQKLPVPSSEGKVKEFLKGVETAEDGKPAKSRSKVKTSEKPKPRKR